MEAFSRFIARIRDEDDEKKEDKDKDTKEGDAIVKDENKKLEKDVQLEKERTKELSDQVTSKNALLEQGVSKAIENGSLKIAPDAATSIADLQNLRTECSILQRQLELSQKTVEEAHIAKENAEYKLRAYETQSGNQNSILEALNNAKIQAEQKADLRQNTAGSKALVSVKDGELAQLKALNRNLKKELELLSEQLRIAKDEMLSNREEIKALTFALKNKLLEEREARKNLEKRLWEKENECLSHDSDFRTVSRTLSITSDERDGYKAKLDDLNERVHEMVNEKSKLQHELRVKENKLDEAIMMRKQTERQLESTKEELNELQLSRDCLHEITDNQKSSVSAAKKQATKYHQEKTELKKTISGLEGEKHKLQRNLRESESEKDQLISDKEKLAKDVIKIATQLENKDELLIEQKHRYENAIENIKLDFINETTKLAQLKDAAENEAKKLKEEKRELEHELELREREMTDYDKNSDNNEYFSREKKDLNNKLQALQNENRDLSSEVKKVNQSLYLLEKDKEHLDKLIQEKDKQYSQLREELNTERHKFMNDIFSLREKSYQQEKQTDNKIADISEKYKRSRSEKEELNMQYTDLLRSYENVKGDIKELEYQNERLNSHIESIGNNTQYAEKQCDVYKARNESLKQQLAKEEEEKQKLKGQLINCQTELIKVKEYYDNYKREGESSITLLTTNQDYTKGLEEQLKDARNQILTLQEELEKTKLEYECKIKLIQDELDAIKGTSVNKIDDLTKENERLSTNLQDTKRILSDKIEKLKNLQTELEDTKSAYEHKSNELIKNQSKLRLELETRQELEERLNKREEMMNELLTNSEKDKTHIIEISNAKLNSVLKRVEERDKELEVQTEHYQDIEKKNVQSEYKIVNEFSTKLKEADDRLKREKMSHSLTKRQLEMAHEDCEILREQLRMNRSKYNQRILSMANFDSGKNRSEKINEIIARSEEKAQRLLESGKVFDIP
ncbi:DgyrCDS13167 [Dimorphilus gyrociliatus]|uniref:DgyrCDS13167 n=1 Tax=Dimorphilus gyrociliatus TaxID=2664684 RepID=A0A7I8W9V6_9ANNE|nr:DgyrCDS13167 [Dimorphilus gyrociliatus]